jgi:hypothetical protein
VKWLLWLLWDPLSALDLRATTGKPDYAKVVGFFGFIVFIGLILAGFLPPLGHTIALLSVLFGWVGWRTFLKSRAATATEERIVEDSEVRYPYGPPTYHYHDD